MSEEAAETSAGAEGLDTGNYEVIRERLVGLARTVREKAEALNERRKETFGGTELVVTGNERVRTENNCVPRDIATVGGYLLFGYNVFIGLKRETRVEDVFSLQQVTRGADGAWSLEPVPFSALPGLFDAESFQREFHELYEYYKESKLDQLRVKDGKLLAVFRTGQGPSAIRVFRWALDGEGRPSYVDNRGERDHTRPKSHDFEWKATTRDDHVQGQHPHVSILDEVFVETVGGDLTIKVEDNTEDGKGIYNEPVDDANQGLDDGQILYAKLGSLILLKILPYGEVAWRYLIYCARTQAVTRVDSIGQTCVQLPEDHGVIFPGGYFLQSGEFKLFEGAHQDLEFLRSVKSPNGEDVLYVFHHRVEGSYVLFPYNLIRKEVQTPIQCHGSTLFDDGSMIVFRVLSDEPTRTHPMQIWQTPFMTPEHAAQAPSDGSFLAKVGNADLVRGISDSLSLARAVEEQAPNRQVYEGLIRAAQRALDAYYWLDHPEVGELKQPIEGVRKNAELILEEFEKVQVLRQQAERALAEALQAQREVERELTVEDWQSVEPFMEALRSLRTQRGRAITLKDLRYMDVARVEALEQEIVAQFERISRAAIEFLLRPAALEPIKQAFDGLLEQIEATTKTKDLAPLGAELEAKAEGLTVLTEVVSGLEVEDPTQRTEVLERISEAFAQQNRVRATLDGRRKQLLSAEGQAEFAAQFRLFSQNVQSAIALADTPEACDEQLSRVLLQLEELESRFSEFDEFLADLAAKREEVYEAFDAKRQTLTDARQRRAQNLFGAAERILAGVGRRAKNFPSLDELNAYFAADPMVLKLQQISAELGELGDSVKADEVLAALKTAKQDAQRGLRDRLDLFSGGENTIKLGRHAFNVNTRPLELTLVPRGEGMALHLTGTDFYEPVQDEGFQATKPFWQQQLVSETPEVYRGEYLAYTILDEAERGVGGRSLQGLLDAQREEGGLLAVVRGYAQDRYDEGYERGIHDHDAALILERLLALYTGAGLLRFPPRVRAYACLFWAHGDEEQQEGWLLRARSLGRLTARLGPTPAMDALAQELAAEVAESFEIDPAELAQAGRYLAEELAQETLAFVQSREALELIEAFLQALGPERQGLEEDLQALDGDLGAQVGLIRAWLEGFLGGKRDDDPRARVFDEASVLILTQGALPYEPSAAALEAEVPGLLGQHPRIHDRSLTLRLDEFLGRLSAFKTRRVPAYRAYRVLVRELLEREKERLRLEEFTPRVLSSFVRNRLVNEVYLPLVGENLAKQIGAAGEGKRTDLMGLLLLVSPPGYGKTTLMEYVANRLGLTFVKVNGPSLGHSVTSLDPAEAPSATARQEVEKVNLAFEMGNNVMLYLDDIQHTHPEFLQKFISLCDGQRRIEGVWKGRTRTYDLRGKKFCVVMAGNPYTESGETFQIPDMLANRADTYNLGDVLEGKDQVFALSYVENALTSNPTLAPLAGRDPEDVTRLLRLARGEAVPTTEFTHAYSGVELNEITAVLKHLFRVRDVLLKVNGLYVRSASMDDAFREEPPFKLQGSYRNMNKLAEKVASALTPDELEALVDDHYRGESQTLTTGAEQNLLKLAELRGRLTPEQAARWAAIKKEFGRQRLLGGRDDDPVTRVTSQLSALGTQVEGVREALLQAAGKAQGGEGDPLRELAQRLGVLAENPPQVTSRPSTWGTWPWPGSWASRSRPCARRSSP
ncbi:MAG: DNA repair ATPase [Planctomycetota bacterium]